MESFENMLSVGGKTNSLGRASEVISLVQKNPSRLDELFACIFAEDAWVRMRAIDSFEKICRDNPVLANAHLDDIFNKLTVSTQPSIQWHLAQIFTEVKLDEEQQARAISWLKNRLKTTGVDWIVSVNSMKALLHFYKQNLVSQKEFAKLLKVQAEHKSKSVRKKALALLNDTEANLG